MRLLADGGRYGLSATARDGRAIRIRNGMADVKA
jgi:hypothetical protein